MENITDQEWRSLQGELSRGETVLWTGKPNPSIHFHPSDWGVIPFSLIWGGFAIFWEAGVSGLGQSGGRHDHVSFFMQLWGVPFVVIGQYMIWGRFFYIAWKKRRVVYAVTTERILTIVRAPQARVISAYLRNLPGVTKELRRNGSGTVKFGEVPSVWNSGRGSKKPGELFLNFDTPVFYDIDNAADVATIVTNQLRKVAAPTL